MSRKSKNFWWNFWRLFWMLVLLSPVLVVVVLYLWIGGVLTFCGLAQKLFGTPPGCW